MKLKYYMRGLGIGIILTALILSISGNKERLSNDEIVSRAKNLGMVLEKDLDAEFEKALEEGKPSPMPSEMPDATPAATSVTVAPAQELTQVPTIIPTAIPTIIPTTIPATIPTIAPAKTPGLEDLGEISFTIKSGMSSGKVAKLLYQLGLVDDADKFNEYIVDAGKANVIQVGTYSVLPGASYEDILNKIAN